MGAAGLLVAGNVQCLPNYCDLRKCRPKYRLPCYRSKYPGELAIRRTGEPRIRAGPLAVQAFLDRGGAAIDPDPLERQLDEFDARTMGRPASLRVDVKPIKTGEAT